VGVGVPVLTPEDIRQMPKTQRIEMLNHSSEVDVYIVAGLCPEAEIVGYFRRLDQEGWVDLLNEVIAGKPTAPVMVSISWGLAEDAPDWSHAALRRSHAALRRSTRACTRRLWWEITVCVAAGDDGPGDQVRHDRARVDLPASSSFALAIAGAKLTRAAADGDIAMCSARAWSIKSGTSIRATTAERPCTPLRSSRCEQCAQYVVNRRHTVSVMCGAGETS
jgi:kumamolisin